MDEVRHKEVADAVGVVVQFGANQLRWLSARGSKHQRQAARLAADRLAAMTGELVAHLDQQDPERQG